MEKKIRDEEYTLLMRISDKLDTVVDDVREMKNDMKFRVHLDDFKRLENEVSNLNKAQGEMSTKMAWFAGGITVLTWFANKFL